MRKKDKKKLVIGFLVILSIFIILTISGKINLFATVPLSSDLGFTPIYCRDYEFTCCNEIPKQSQIISLKQGEAWQCPYYAVKCEVVLSYQFSSSHGYYIGEGVCDLEDTIYTSPYWRCSNEKKIINIVKQEIKAGAYVYTTERKQCIGECPSGNIKVSVKVYEQRLDFCGKAGCTQGVPVLGADGCKFNPLDGKVYTTTKSLINAISYTVPLKQCVLSWTGNRYICGNKEESCSSDSDCGEHTYGRFECSSRTLQEYGCVEFGTPIPLERDRLPDESGWGSESPQILFGQRCDIISAKQVQCCGDTDCGLNYFCDRTSWTCKREVSCRQNSDCGVSIQCDIYTKQLKTPICRSGQCTFDTVGVECCGDENCPIGYYCTADRKCSERIAVCQLCPFECCEDECTIQGGYLDKPCPPEKPYCVDNICKVEYEPTTYCENCDEFAFSKIIGSIWKEKQCKPKLLHSLTTCFLSFIKLILIPIVLIFALLFGQQLFSSFKALKKQQWITWILALIIAGLLAYLVYVTFWIGLILFVVYLIFRIIVGGKLLALKKGIRKLRK